MHQSTTEQFTVEFENGLAVLTLNRPEARNAMTAEMMAAMRDAFSWAAEDDAVGAVLLTGAGTAFCSGADVKNMGKQSAGPPPTKAEAIQQLRERHHGLAGVLRGMRKPTIAALPGAAAGAGMALALSCDLRIAAESAFLTTGYGRIGLSGDYGIAWLLTQTVGPGRARQLLLTGERCTARDALAIGLVTEVVADDELALAGRTLGARLASGPRIALAAMKDNLDEAAAIDHATAIDREAERLASCVATDDHREAVRAFAEKREPVFRGR